MCVSWWKDNTWNWILSFELEWHLQTDTDAWLAESRKYFCAKWATCLQTYTSVHWNEETVWLSVFACNCSLKRSSQIEWNMSKTDLGGMWSCSYCHSGIIFYADKSSVNRVVGGLGLGLAYYSCGLCLHIHHK